MENTTQQFVVTGPPLSLIGLNTILSKLKSHQDESRIPFHTRKPSVQTRFLPVTVPFHSPYLQDAVKQLLIDVKKKNLSLDTLMLNIPVYHTFTGKLLLLLLF